MKELHVSPIAGDAGRVETVPSDMRIAFVHTPMSTVEVPERETYWRGFDLQYHGAYPGMHHMEDPVMWELPHWVTWMGGVLEEAGYDNLGVLDFYTSGSALSGPKAINAAHVRNALERYGEAQAFLFSPMTANTHLALDIAGIAKELYPDSKTIFGGIMATPEHEHLAADRRVDYVVTGRGERALPRLLRAIEGRGPIASVGQLTHAKDGKMVTNSRQYPLVLPKDLPPDKIDLFSPETGRHIRYIREVYGLGCPYQCSFCTIQTIGQQVNYFPVERVIESMDAYRDRFGRGHHFYMGDETFTMHDGPTFKLLDAMQAHGGIEYDAQTRLNRLRNPDLIRAMGKSGCRWLEIGIETGHEPTSQRLKQHTKHDTLRSTLANLHEAGIAVCAFLVNGLPGQTPGDMLRSTEWAAELIQQGSLDAAYLTGLVPYPGSDMYNHPEKHGLEILHKDFSLYHEDLAPVFRTAQAPEPEKVHQAFREGLIALGQAMSRQPTFGSMPDAEELKRLGSFWTGQHV